MSFSRTVLVLLLTLLLSNISSSAFAMSDEERSFLLMYFKEEEIQIVSATRSLKSITRVAENVEVVTKDDIELMNAHTVTEVLNRVNGIQMQIGGSGLGSSSNPEIQGSNIKHVAVFLDGVLLNGVAGNTAELGTIPVQFIERIEIIKGPGSSVWGSSLGGVINIISKSPGSREKIGGTMQASYGERNTGDFRAEVYGKREAFGYYLYAGRIQTDGFMPDDNLSDNNLYAKFEYGLIKDTTLQYILFYNNAHRGRGQFIDFDVSTKERIENLLSSLSLRSALSKDLDLDVSLKFRSRKSRYNENLLSTGEDAFNANEDDRRYSGSAKLTWRQGIHQVVAGTDINHDIVKTTSVNEDKLSITKWAFFANDTISLGRLTVIPGLRVDKTDQTSSFLSPSLGITYEIANKTLLRAYVARGFSDPTLVDLKGSAPWYVPNPDLKPEKVWSYQAGMETGVLKYLWLKLSAFRHDIRDSVERSDVAPDGSVWTFVNAGRFRRQGIEAEIKTAPIYNFILAAGTSFIKSKNLETGEDERNVPTNTYDISLAYDDKKSFRGVLKGHYIWWNMDGYYTAQYNGFIFDLNLIKSILKKGDTNLEVFATGHNIFNGSQYWTTPYINARRWLEAGLRMKF